MDVHTGMAGVTPETLKEAHDADLAIHERAGHKADHVYEVPVQA